MRRPKFLALVLVFVMLLGLCACKSEAAPEVIVTENEPVAAEEDFAE